MRRPSVKAPRAFVAWCLFLIGTSALPADGFSAVPGSPERLDGVWRSRGYGVIAAIDDRKVRFYDWSNAGCLRQMAYPWKDYALADLANLSPGGRSLTAIGPWGLTVMRFDRLASLPAPCLQTDAQAAEALRNFDVFWQTVDEHYAFFQERGVDWQRLRDKYRPMISATTTDEALLGVMGSMIAPLSDRHMMVIAGPALAQSGVPDIIARWQSEEHVASVPAIGALLRRKLPDYLGPSWNRHLDAGSTRQLSPNLITGTAASGRVGYLAIASESGYEAADPKLSEVEAAAAAFEEVFSSFEGKRGLIVDLRMNFGGSDEIALIIAGLLADRDRPAFDKCAREGELYTPAQHTMLRRREHAYAGPAIVLTSRLTASAGENIASMARSLPQVILVGELTAGVHSDPLVKSLPNGWRFTVSNERFVAADGTTYEGLGIPPDVLVRYEPEAVRSTGQDPALDKALELLEQPSFKQVLAGVKRTGSMGRPGRCH